MMAEAATSQRTAAAPAEAPGAAKLACLRRVAHSVLGVSGSGLDHSRVRRLICRLDSRLAFRLVFQIGVQFRFRFSF